MNEFCSTLFRQVDDVLEALKESSFNVSNSPELECVIVFTSVKLLCLLSVRRAQLTEPIQILGGASCYFHFSQAIWRKVMKSGLYVAYMQDKSFNRFVRMVMALAFLPINRLEPALDRLREYSFSLTPATPPPATRKSRFSKRKYI